VAQRGKPSVAHEFDKRECCIHCGMYKSNVERINHVCKQARENIVDEREAKLAELSLEDYRLGHDLEARKEQLKADNGE
jgi:hypothetical protein